jgi:hypothetical protein
MRNHQKTDRMLGIASENKRPNANAAALVANVARGAVARAKC